MKTSLVLVSPSGKSAFVGLGTGYAGRNLLRKAVRKLEAIFHGEGIVGRLVYRPYVVAATQSANVVLTFASVQAADHLDINGAALTAANGSPTADQFDSSLSTDILVASDFVRAMNASITGLIINHVQSSNKKVIVTCSTVAVNDWVDIAGVRLFAKAGTAAVNTGLLINEFSQGGTNTQDGDALVLAINGHPTLSQIVFAINLSGAVHIYERPPTTGQTIRVSTSDGSTLAITGSLTALTAAATVLVESMIPGTAGNAVTVASSAGTIAIAGSVARLAGGTQSTYTY